MIRPVGLDGSGCGVEMGAVLITTGAPRDDRQAIDLLSQFNSAHAKKNCLQLGGKSGSKSQMQGTPMSSQPRPAPPALAWLPFVLEPARTDVVFERIGFRLDGTTPGPILTSAESEDCHLREVLF